MSLGISVSAISGFASAEAGHIHQRARDLCRRTAISPLLLAALGGLWQFFYYRGDFVAAQDLAEEHRKAVLASGEVNRLCASYDALGYTAYRVGRLTEAVAQLGNARELYDEIPRPEGTALNPLDLGVAAESGLAMVAAVLGRAAALAHASRGIERAGQLAPRQGALSLAYAHLCASRTHLLRREPIPAAEHARRAIELGTEYGYTMPVMAGRLDLAAAEIEMGEAAGGVELLTSALDGWRTVGFELDRPYWLISLADGLRRCGNVDGALATLEEARAVIDAHGECLWLAPACRLRGEILAERSGGTEAATGELEMSLKVASAQSAVLFQLRAGMSLARIRVEPDARRASLDLVRSLLEATDVGARDRREARALLETAAPQTGTSSS